MKFSSPSYKILFANLILLFCYNLPTVNCLSFVKSFKIPENIPGDFKKFLTDFYTAVDASKAEESVSYFAHNPVPVVTSSGVTVTGKPAIIALFKKRVADATFEKVLTSVNRLDSDRGIKIEVHGTITKTLKSNGEKTKQTYYAELNFLNDQYRGALFKMMSRRSNP
ncbi:secreted protein [Melampsora americana]|nr:secreted protein [Melampsora americana]